MNTKMSRKNRGAIKPFVNNLVEFDVILTCIVVNMWK